MGIDAKETGAMLWKILGFSMNTSIKFMRNHPVFSGVSMFLLVLYIFLPSLLFFLIYSSPVLACAIVYAREKMGLRFSGKSCCGGGEKKNGSSGAKSHLRQQRSVRRNARMKVEEWDSHTSEEEDDKVILTSLYNDLLGRTPHFEESPKAIETDIEEEKDEKAFGGEDLGVSSRDLGDLKVENEPMVCNCEINEEKYRGFDGKEETKEGNSNVNEYGISEIERNMRLESLIARRRARRLFKLALDQRNRLQANETTSPTQNNNNNNLHITVPRNKNNNMFEKHRNFSSDGTVMGLQVPGSAPSVMAQGRNPFDIPYDPQEERPILTGDSFDQEFSLFNTKDMFFCRHESFCRFALLAQEPSQCLNSPASASDIATTRKRLDLDNEYMDHTEQKLPCEDVKEATIEEDDSRSVEREENGEREVEVNEEMDSNQEEDDDDSSCSDESESEFSRLNKSELREAICHSMDNYPSYLVNQTRSSIPNPLPRASVAPRLDDNDMLYARRCANTHSRTFSIASDMQVEVSEVGSPPTTVDWLDEWSNGGGESYMYDTDIDREIIHGEESRKRLSDQYESRSGTGLMEETKPVCTPDHKDVVGEHLRELGATSLLDRKIQTEDDSELVREDIIEQKPSSSNDLYKRSNSGKFGGLLFHTSESLSSITEEPETVLDSIHGGIPENMNYMTEESSDQRSLISMDSSEEKLTDEEVAVKLNDDLCASPKIDLDTANYQQWNNIQGENDTEIDMKKYENTQADKYEAAKSLLDASLDIPYTEPFERELKEEEEPNLDNFIEEKTKQPETEAIQCDLNVLTELLENKVTEENGPKLVEKIDEKVEPIEQDSHFVLEGSSSHPPIDLTEDRLDIENARNVSNLQAEEGNNLTLDESTDQEISEERVESCLVKDLYAELIQEHNNKTNAEEESVVSADNENSQEWTQQCGTNSSEGISPRILETTQQQEHEDVIIPNTVFQETGRDEFVALADESASTEYNDEGNLKHNDQIGEVMENKPEADVEPMHHNIDLVTKEDNDESMKVVEAMHIAETVTTKDENRVSED